MKSIFKKIKDTFFKERAKKIVICRDNYKTLPEEIGGFKLSKDYQMDDRAGLYFDSGGTNKSMLLILRIESFSYHNLEIEDGSSIKFIYEDSNAGLQEFLELRSEIETVKNKILKAE